MRRRLLSGPRHYCHDLRPGDVLRDCVALLRRLALGFRLQEPKSFTALSIKNLREEVLVAVTIENQPRLRLALATNTIDIEVGRLAVVRAANDQCVRGVAGGEPTDRIFASLELFAANHEIERDVCADGSAETCKPNNCHGNDKGQCGDNAQYLLFQNYLRLVFMQRPQSFAADFYLQKMRLASLLLNVAYCTRLSTLRTLQRRCFNFDAS